MAIKHRFTLMCDEIRREDNGKFIVLGLYTPNISLMSLPAILPALTFFQYLEADRLGSFSQRISLNSLETGKVIASNTSMLNVQPQANVIAPWTVLNAIGFRNVMIDRAGAYNLSVQ
ncbi:MAG: hypothetical protein V4587_19945, partial [Acidobacteriota bacterium]